MNANQLSCAVHRPDRRQFMRMAACAGLAGFSTGLAGARLRPSGETRLFDGHTLHGWITAQNCQYSISSRDILDFRALVTTISDPRNPLGALLAARIAAAIPQAPTFFTMSTSALAGELTRVLDGPPLYDPPAFARVTLRPETRKLLHSRGRAKQRI